MSSELPNAIEAEQALLGAIFIENDAYNEVLPIIGADHFYEPIHRDIFEAIGELLGSGMSANPITLKSRLPEDAKIGEMTIMQYLARLAADAVTVGGAAEYARAIYDAHARRVMISYAQSVMESARRPSNASGWDLAVAASEGLDRITRDFSSTKPMPTLGDAMEAAWKATIEANQFKKPAGFRCDVEAVDDLIGPAEPRQQILIGGATKSGKTALAMQMVMGYAHAGAVFIYSGEMTLQQLAMREIGRRTGISAKRQKEGRVSKQELSAIEHVYEGCHGLPIFIEKRRLTLDQLRTVMKDIKRRHGLVACVIDHIGLLNWPRGGPKSEWEQAQEATRSLKAIYEELEIIGISLSQLKKNTFVEEKGFKRSLSERISQAIYKRPKYSDLMGAVERDADHVIIPFNPVPIIAEMEPQQGTEDYGIWQNRMTEYEGRAQIILALSREQRWPQWRNVEWHGETTSFGAKYQREMQEALL